MGFESPHKRLEDEDKLAKERFESLPKSIRDIAIANKVNPEKIVSSSVLPEETISLEGASQVVPSVSERRAKNRKDFPTWIEKSQPPEKEI